MSQFRAVLGVDQTGAKGKLGFAKPLPASLILDVGGSPRLCSPLFLSSLNKKSIEMLLAEQDFACEWHEVLIVADCVLGLPKKVIGNHNPLKKILNLMDKAFSSGGLGLRDGELFFSKICHPLKLDDGDLLRIQEKTLNCLSVFKSKPFQRNVQTGTYRIWSDLGNGKEYLNFNIWPYQQKEKRAYLCEGYPAHAMKVVKLEAVKATLNIDIFSELSKDHKDATALALLGVLFFDSSNEIKEITEGCILTAPLCAEA